MVFLDDTRIGDGMKLQIGTVQHIDKQAYAENEFLDKLTRESWIE